MKKLWIASLVVLSLAACGGEEEKAEVLQLNSQKDKLSYSIGADHAQQLVQDPGFKDYNKDEIVKGFDMALDDPKTFDMSCQEQIQQMMVELQRTGTSTMGKNPDVAQCIGKLFGSMFVDGWSQENFIKRFDLKLVKEGFKSAMQLEDTLVPKQERDQLINGLIAELNEKIMVSSQKNEAAFFNKVRQIPGMRELDKTGIFIETIQEGKGGSPGLADDVRAHYILMSAEGDTLQSSYEMGSPISFNLSGGMIQAWSMAFPKLKKGGKYKMYVPNGLGYAGQPPQGSGIKPYAPLVFFVEVVDYGKPGSLTSQQGM